MASGKKILLFLLILAFFALALNAQASVQGFDISVKIEKVQSTYNLGENVPVEIIIQNSGSSARGVEVTYELKKDGSSENLIPSPIPTQTVQAGETKKISALILGSIIAEEGLYTVFVRVSQFSGEKTYSNNYATKSFSVIEMRSIDVPETSPVFAALTVLLVLGIILKAGQK